MSNKVLLPSIVLDTWKSINPCDIILVCRDSDRGYCFNGMNYSQVVDSLGEVLIKNGIKCSAINPRFQFLNDNEIYGSSGKINASYLRTYVTQKIIQLLISTNKGLTYRRKCEEKLWKNIIRTSKARIVLAIQPDVGLCRAGAALGVPVVDVQHGVIDVTADYYCISRMTLLEPTELPVAYLVWNENSAASLEPIASLNNAEILVIGNPWVCRFMHNNTGDQLVEDATKIWKRSGLKIPEILVTLQHGLRTLSPKSVPNGVMPDCLEKVVLDTCNFYKWRIRLHPAQMKGDERVHVENYLKSKFGLSTNIDWVECTAMPLPVALGRASLHLTHFSSVTIEATWFGLKTGLLDPELSKGGNHEHLYTYERDMQNAVQLNLNEGAIKNFIEANVIAGRNKIEFRQDWRFNEMLLLEFVNRYRNRYDRK